MRLCPRTWCALLYWGEVSGWALLLASITHRPRCSVLRELSKITNLVSACQPLRLNFFEAFSGSQLPSAVTTAQTSKTSVRPEIESRSSKLLFPSALALGGIAVAWVCGSRLLLSSYTAVKRLDCAPACHQRSL